VSLGTSQKYYTGKEDEINGMKKGRNQHTRNIFLLKKIKDEIKCKFYDAKAKREANKRHRLFWETFISHLESYNMYKIRSSTYKILRCMTKCIKESVKIKRGRTKEQYLKIYT
jgi:hypothetical protein